MPRLAACHHCSILQRIPDVPSATPKVPARMEWTNGESYVYRDDQGQAIMVPAYDPVLEDFVSKHDHGFDDARFIASGMVQVWSVDQRTWDSMDVVTKIKDELKTQFDTFYEEQDEYREAALKCYNNHGNPDLSSGCPDYLNDDRRIGPATYDDGEGRTITVPPQFRHYLCYVCPYQQTYIQVELRRRRGEYEEHARVNAQAKQKRRKSRR